MGYRERLIWANFLPAALFFAYWLIALVRTGMGASGRWMNFSTSLLLMVVLQAAGSGLVAVLPRRREPEDERETQISLRTYRWAYAVLLWGTILWLCGLYHGQEPTPGSTGFDLLLSIVGVELARSVAMLCQHAAGRRA